MWYLIVIGRIRVFFEEFEQWHGEERLLAETHKITADAVIQDALFGHICELAIDVEHTSTRRDYQRHLTETIKRAIDEMPFEDYALSTRDET